MSIGAGGIRSSSLAFGADQLDNKDNSNNHGGSSKLFWLVLCCYNSVSFDCFYGHWSHPGLHGMESGLWSSSDPNVSLSSALLPWHSILHEEGNNHRFLNKAYIFKNSEDVTSSWSYFKALESLHGLHFLNILK